jgi:hypothetical protein
MSVFRHSLFLPLLLAGFRLVAADDHWAFQPVERPAVPAVADRGWIQDPIDAFVRARQEAADVSPSPPAARGVLLRRLSLDLLGLPPSPAEVLAFQQDPAPDAVERQVDRLLASPHFGERWGRHWLDLARYADSDGYLGDSLRKTAWIYRDWVIDAINADQPFDAFTVEQLAGDLMEPATRDRRVAVGFHRNTLKNTEAGADRELNRTKEVVDRVNTTGTVWLGLTVGCAECHAHKHDPISQEEYYGLYAFFNNTDEASVTVATNKAPSFAERRKERRETFVHVRGDYARPGVKVPAGTPAVMPALRPRDEMPDRLDLARWLMDGRNPLTARVTVNRIWQRLFGVGLVASSDDFGTKGDPPTHPRLLDWLAAELRDNGWSRKALIRRIVLSATYQQSSRQRPELASHPTGNRLLWRQNSFRLDAETIRDVHLVASGLYDARIGGAGIRPPLPAFVTDVGRSVKWPVSVGGERYRRGLYIFFKRTVPYPMLITFDAPDSSVSCSRRERSNSPLQALTLLNDPVFFECAEALGKGVKTRHGDNFDDALRELVRLGLAREPSGDELRLLRSATKDMAADRNKEKVEPLVAAARIVMNLDEFITRD